MTAREERITRRRNEEAGASSPSTRVPDLAAKVAFLRQAGSYPQPTSRVEAVETHMSWLFLTDDHAYKLKKPFKRSDIDYSTPALRRLNCMRELRLNRRLTEDVYQAVVALTVEADGRLALDGAGRRVDWLVRMRRLPRELTLEHRLRGGIIAAGDVGRIVARLVPFFASAPRARITPAAYRRRLAQGIADAASALVRPAFGLAGGGIDAIAAALTAFVTAHGRLLDARVRAGRIVEGHGDLRPEHIYLTTPPTNVDCIEFDRALRLRDPVDELAFLAMECDRAGRPELDAWLFGAYRELAGDDPPRALVDFHKARNAFLRARIAIWHLDDPDTGPPQGWVDRTNDYLDHAHRLLVRLGQVQSGGARRRESGQ
jgi:aminoglycoside phosphotransferase family enzyme